MKRCDYSSITALRCREIPQQLPVSRRESRCHYGEDQREIEQNSWKIVPDGYDFGLRGAADDCRYT